MDEKTLKSVKKIAKGMAKEFAAEVKGGKTHFDVAPRFILVVDSKGSHYRFRVGDKDINLPHCEGSEYVNLMNAIRDEFKALVGKKLKGYVMRPMYESVSCGYSTWTRSNRDSFTNCLFYKPCKEFKKLTKRLSQLGVAKVDTLDWDWRIDYVGGKRSWYNVEETFPCCVSSTKVNKVLDFLKGLKKVEVEIQRMENLEDRERGIEYETEWSGSIDYSLVVRAAKGTLFA